MAKVESPQSTRRTTRSSLSAPSDVAVRSIVAADFRKPTLVDLTFGGEPMSLDDLLSRFPGREKQIVEILELLGPLDAPMFPIFIYGGASTGKSSVILQILRHLNRPFVYSSCVTCYNPRILFESVLNQLLLHRKSSENGYSSARRCDKPSDFVNFLREVLLNVITELKENAVNKSSSSKLAGRPAGRMVYLVFDNLELVREWDKGSCLIPFLFNLGHVLKIPEVGLIFLSKTSPDTYTDMGYIDPIPVCFPEYTEGDIRRILLENQANKRLYSCFLDSVLGPFCRVTRRLDELSTSLAPLFRKYCEPMSDLEAVPNDLTKRKLSDHLRPHVTYALNETFWVTAQPSVKGHTTEGRAERGSYEASGNREELNQLDFHMSICAKYLLISAFLASRNPATYDASVFDSTGGSENRKRKRKTVEKSASKENAEQESLMKGTGTFPLERLIAIFQCIAKDPFDEEGSDETKIEEWSGEDMSDVLIQLSSLCGANFIVKGGSCPLEGSTRYRSTVSEDLALKVARSLNFPLAKYMYRR